MTLLRGEIAGCGRGLVSGTGSGIMALDTTVRDPRTAAADFPPLAMLVGEEAWLAVAGGDLEAAEGESAIQCLADGRLALERVRVQGGRGARVAGGYAYLTDCAVVGSETTALEVKGDAGVVLDR